MYLPFPLNKIVRFLWYSWLRRRRRKKIGLIIGTANETSEHELRPLIRIATCILLVYMPLSVSGMFTYLNQPKIPYSFSRVHGPTWKYIILVRLPKAYWQLYLPNSMAFAIFITFGLTKNGIKFFGEGFKWVRDGAVKTFQLKLSFIRGFLNFCKEVKAVQSIQNSEALNIECSL